MSGSFDPDMEPGGLFNGLDDPTPPAFGGDLLSGVMQRGHHLRQQRRIAYGVGSGCAAVLIAGAAVGVAATGGHRSGQVVDPATQSASPHHTKKPTHRSHTPNTPIGGSRPGGTGHDSKHHPKPCVSTTPTPTPTDVTPAATSTPGSTLTPSPWLPTATPGTDETTPAATTTPRSSDCVTPPPTPTDEPMGSETPTPTYSLPPLLPPPSQAVEGMVAGTL